ncbi:MAG: preprotein translocase subunit YajC [Myxococcales bacterium]|nr:preprotein translocase subunit YajC [Myxococcales bacterium]
MSMWMTNLGGALLQIAQADPTPAGSGAAAAAAAAAGEASKSPGTGAFVEQLLIFGAIFLVFWLLILRPQQKKAKEHKGFLDTLNVGTKVVTASGIYGKITALEDKTVKLEIAPKVVIKVLKSQVAGVEGQAAEAVANATAR